MPISNRRAYFIHQLSLEDLLFLVVFIVGIFFRLWQYGNFSMTNDELSLINRVINLQAGDVLHASAIDGHPPGMHLFMSYWVRWVGTGPWLVRLPFVISSCLCLVLIYILATKWFNKVTALFTVTAFAFLAFPILYGELARPYSFGLFFSLVAAWFWSRIVFEGSTSWADLAFWVIAVTLSLYTHYFSWLAVVVMGFTGLAFLPRHRYLHYILAGVAVLLLYLPGLGVLFHHIGIGGLDWLGKPTQDFPLQFLLFVFNDAASLLYLFVIISFTFLFWSRKRIEWRRFHSITLLWFIIPFTFAYIKSILGKPILQEPILLFSLPYMLMFGFSFYTKKKGRNQSNVPWLSAWGAWVFLCLFTLTTKAHFFTDRLGRFGNFKELSSQLLSWQDQYGKANITFATAVNAPYYIQYYPKMQHKDISFVQYINENDSCMDALESIISKNSTPFFVYSWCHVAHPPGVEDMVRKYYPITVDDKQYNHYGFTLFHKLAPVPAKTDTISLP